MTQRGRHSGGMYYCKPDKIHNKCKEVDSLGVGMTNSVDPHGGVFVSIKLASKSDMS